MTLVMGDTYSSKSRMGLSGACGRGEKSSYCLMATVFILQDEKFKRPEHNSVNVLNNPELAYLKMVMAMNASHYTKNKKYIIIEII